MTKSQLYEVLELHKKWLNGEVGGAKADLIRANLCIADLGGANLSRANLSEANLHRANLSRAYLSEANLHEANLCIADLGGANLHGVLGNLKHVKSLQPANK